MLRLRCLTIIDAAIAVKFKMQDPKDEADSRGKILGLLSPEKALITFSN